MINSKFFLIIVFSMLLHSSNTNGQCNNLPSNFSSYQQAIRTIQNTKFVLTDRLPSGKSSWIKTANYYSCNGTNGYMIYTTDKGRQYIHSGLPLNVWQAFKTASSSGSFYVRNMKNRYRFQL